MMEWIRRAPRVIWGAEPTPLMLLAADGIGDYMIASFDSQRWMLKVISPPPMAVRSKSGRRIVPHNVAVNRCCPGSSSGCGLHNEPQRCFGLVTSEKNVILLQKASPGSFVVAAQHQLRIAMSRLFPIVWLALFLLGQGGLLLHKVDLDAHANGDTCELCLVSSSLDHALASSSTPPLGATTLRFPPTRVHVKLSPTYWSAFSARAPPVLLFSS